MKILPKTKAGVSLIALIGFLGLTLVAQEAPKDEKTDDTPERKWSILNEVKWDGSGAVNGTLTGNAEYNSGNGFNAQATGTTTYGTNGTSSTGSLTAGYNAQFGDLNFNSSLNLSSSGAGSLSFGISSTPAAP